MRTLLTALALLCPTLATAADMPVKAPPNPFLAAPCTLQDCSGWTFGFNLIGVGSNMDIAAAGINTSVFTAGGMIGVNGGYQFWNGVWFFAVEVSADYDVTNNLSVSGGNPNGKYLISEMVKVGMGLSGLLGVPGVTTPTQSPVPITIPAQLAAALITPYAQVGAVQRSWGKGWGAGAGAEFIIAKGWNLDLSYIRVLYGNGSVVSPTQIDKSENLVRASFIKKF